MKKKNIAVVIGTRPEAIKMAPLYLMMKSNPNINVSLIATAQHRRMLDQVLNVFKIKCDVDLDIMQPNQSLSQVSARVLKGVQESISNLKLDALLVHGDTTTCLFASLAAFYERVPVGHVEAGLRTYNFDAPWPEEMNRRLVDPICRWCFAPTKGAAENLRGEKIPEDHIFVTGNTIVDALSMSRDIALKLKPEIPGFSGANLNSHRLILVTGHRRESFGKPFEDFCLALHQLVNDYPDTMVVYPVHLNPNVQEPVNRILGNHDRIFLIEPLEYLQFIYLTEQSYLIITDSGGIQEEAPSFHKPVLVTRTVTERPEAVAAGLAKLVGTDREKIVAETSRLLEDSQSYAKMSNGSNPYGDGNASKRIIDVLLSTI